MKPSWLREASAPTPSSSTKAAISVTAKEYPASALVLRPPLGPLCINSLARSRGIL